MKEEAVILADLVSVFRLAAEEGAKAAETIHVPVNRARQTAEVV